MPNDTSITIRKLAPKLKRLLRMRAAGNGHSMEEEAREILGGALAVETPSGEHLVQSMRRRFARAGYVELEIAPREVSRRIPDFS